MHFRKIGRKTVKAIGLGVMALDEYKPKTRDKEAIEFLKNSIGIGVDFFDTADVYGLGRNEALLGKALSEEEKNKVLIASKGGCTRPRGFDWSVDGRPEHLRGAIKESLERLQIKQIELYQLHAIDRNVPIIESIKVLKELQEQGYIKNIGISNFDLNEVQEAQKYAEIVSVQNPFNYSRRMDEHTLLPYLRDNKITYIAYFPLGQGMLIGNGKLQLIASNLEITPSQLALAWIINKWENVIAIPGTKNSRHLTENMGAISIKLSYEDIQRVDSIYNIK